MSEEEQINTRLQRERMSRRWTMAKRLHYGLWVQVIILAGFLVWDKERAEILITALDWPMAICAMSIGAVMGVDSWKK